MKQAFFTGILLSVFSLLSFSQASSSYKFGTTGSNVIAYKQGTSCTASSYAFYTISDAGLQAATPFYTLANVNREVNGIGINPIDRFLYGVEYDRDGSCAFSNFHLKRYDTQGSSDDLGTLPAPTGGTVTAALGCATSNGNFVYSTKDASGASYVSVIANVASLPANATGTLTIVTSKQITNNAGNFSYADWAVHPTNGNLYTYGIANIGGVSTGKLLVLDPATGVLQSTGTADNTNFLDAARDNFGGVYFGADGMLYGVNVSTRKLYKMNPISGVATYISTMTGSGQIRADMGSYTTGWIVLPINFTAIDITTKGENTRLHWSVAGSVEVKEFTIEQNSGSGFVETGSVSVTNKNTTDYSAGIAGNISAQYRIKASSTDGRTVYSPVVMNTVKAVAGLQLLANPVRNALVRFVPLFTASVFYNIVGSNGQVIKSGTATCSKGVVTEIDAAALRRGIYLLQLANGTTVRFAIA